MRIVTSLILCLLTFISYTQIYDDYIGGGHDSGVVVTSSSAETDHRSSVNGAGVNHNLLDASRFLSHATLGADVNQMIYLDSIGYDQWLDEQFGLPATSHLERTIDVMLYYFDKWVNDLGQDTALFPQSVAYHRMQWSDMVMNHPDLLRHRVTLALSEILVISDQSDLLARPLGIASYYDVLSEHTFGNFKELLMDIAVHPAMGFYLSHLNNPKTDPINDIHPDENFAREIMQLFSIGLYELNMDGTRKVDNDGNFIPTYDNNDIKELAKVFTGLGMGAWISDEIPFPPTFGTPVRFIDLTTPMEMYDLFHEPGPKTIVGDFVIPSGQTGMEDIEMAIDHLFNHPNVAPFISYRLIQRLVKSNPTGDYVERIAQVFNDNGQGVRGDLKAVVKAILMDGEARNCDRIEEPSNGKLKEPIQRYFQFLKAMRATTPDGRFWTLGASYQYYTEQWAMSSPSVFNFFLPDYQPSGDIADAGLVAPEFQIFNSGTSVNYINYFYFVNVADYYNEIPNELNLVGVADDFTAVLNVPELEYLRDYPDALVDYLDLVFAHGNMSEETKNGIVAAITPLAIAPDILVKLALYLTMLSPDYAIMK